MSKGHMWPDAEGAIHPWEWGSLLRRDGLFPTELTAFPKQLLSLPQSSLL